MSRRDITLAAAEEDIELKVRKPSPEEVAEAKQVVAAANGRVLKGLAEVYSRETVLLADYPDTVPVKLQALRVGDLGIAAIPCEVFTEIGLAIKKGSPHQQTFTISLANGYNGSGVCTSSAVPGAVAPRAGSTVSSSGLSVRWACAPRVFSIVLLCSPVMSAEM